MISFDDNGNIIPVGINFLSIEDFRSFFVFTTTRDEIFKYFLQYTSDFQKELVKEFSQWIGGSFTTRKENPSDIDLVNIVTYSDELNKKQSVLLKFLTTGGSKIVYKVDGYFIPIYPDNDPRYHITVSWMNYWKNFFGHDRFNNPRGIVEISFN